MLSTLHHPPTWMPLWSWRQSVSHSVCVAAASRLPTRVSVASGLPLSDRLSTADSARSSDDDPGPGVGPRSLSCPHSFSFCRRTAASVRFTDGGREDYPCRFALKRCYYFRSIINSWISFNTDVIVCQDRTDICSVTCLWRSHLKGKNKRKHWLLFYAGDQVLFHGVNPRKNETSVVHCRLTSWNENPVSHLCWRFKFDGVSKLHPATK